MVLFTAHPFTGGGGVGGRLGIASTWHGRFAGVGPLSSSSSLDSSPFSLDS